MGSTHSLRNGDAQCCQLSNSADPFSDLFPFKKAPKPYLVSENRRYCRTRSCFSQHAQSPLSLSLYLSLSICLLSFCSSRAHTHLSRSLHLLSFCSAHGREEQSLIQLNTDISSLILHASIAKITAQLLSLSYGCFI